MMVVLYLQHVCVLGFVLCLQRVCCQNDVFLICMCLQVTEDWALTIQNISTMATD